MMRTESDIWILGLTAAQRTGMYRPDGLDTSGQGKMGLSGQRMA